MSTTNVTTEVSDVTIGSNGNMDAFLASIAPAVAVVA